MTFTARAAGEMRTRLRQLGADGVQARTFHAAAMRQLAYFWPKAVGGAPPRLLENKFALVARAASRLHPGTSEIRDLLAEIEWATCTLTSPEQYVERAAGRGLPYPAADVAAVYEAYRELKSDQGVADFDDMLLYTAGILEEHPVVAQEFRDRYRSFVVDEYQDVTPLQQRLLDAWLGDSQELCVVGDAQQTIYSFTGATPSYLLGFRRRYPDASVVRLVRDYRSTPQVVALANKVLAGVSDKLELRGQRTAGPEPSFAEHADEPAEAVAVARRCTELISQGVPAREIAVLYRINAQSAAYEAALSDAGVPYVLRGAEKFFQRPEVREALLLLRGQARATDAEELPLPQTVAGVLAIRGWTAEPPASSGAVRDRWESLNALHQLAVEHAELDLPAFVSELEERAAAQHAPTVDGVTLATLHAAKGLEWDAVFLVGLVDGTVPLVHADTPEQVEEERRLLYVGVTRAREHLTLSWALSRSPGGRGTRRPSRFLDGLLGDVVRTGPPRPARSSRTLVMVTCRVCSAVLSAAADRKRGRCAGCPADRDEVLFEALREWRLGRAKELGQPAYCVFTDATLEAIAERRPTSVAALVDIPGIGQAKLDKFGDEVLALVTKG